MKHFTFLLLLAFSVMVHAEKAASPVLLAPTDAAKNLVKDNIVFRWQKSTNETAAQVLGYRLLISENSRFSGYAIKDGTCNSSCIVAVVNNASPNYTASMAQTQNVYFWKVQAIGATGKSAWSRVNSFKTETPIPVPSLTQITATPTSIVKGNALSFAATLTGVLPKNYSVKVNYGNGLVLLKGSGSNYTLSVTPTSLGSLVYSVGIYDNKNTLNGNLLTDTFEVTSPAPVNVAPTVKLISGESSTVVDATYNVQFQANDVDNNLSSIVVDWGDGTSDSATVRNYETPTFSHSYVRANNYTLSATAYDSSDLSSRAIFKTVAVSKPIVKISVPSILNAVATPNSVVQGKSVTFSASLSGNLPDTYSVKANIGNGLVSMSGSGTNYSVSQTPTKTGMQTFSVGIYDNKSVLKSNSMTGNFEVTQPAPVNVAPTLSFISGNTSATTNANYSVQLQASDSDNNLSSIVIDWSDGASDSKTATNGATLTFSHIYTSAATYNWSATAYDSGSLKSNVVSKNVAVAKPVVAIPIQPVDNSGTSSSSSAYTKVCNNGQLAGQGSCPTDPVLGSNSTQWGCTLDNKTQLIWEIKTDDGGLRDKDWEYSWYKPDGDNGGDAGSTDTIPAYGIITPNCSTKDNCNTYAFTNAVNTQGLCGKKDWRMPTIDELEGLLTTTSTVNQPLNEKLYIDPNYFPNTSYGSWSSSPSASSSDYAWFVGFFGGDSYSTSKENSCTNVRLVR